MSDWSSETQTYPLPIGPSSHFGPDPMRKSQPSACASTGNLPNRLRRVHQDRNTLLVGHLDRLSHGHDASVGRGYVANQKELRLFRDSAVEGLNERRVAVVHLDDGDVDSRAPVPARARRPPC